MHYPANPTLEKWVRENVHACKRCFNTVKFSMKECQPCLKEMIRRRKAGHDPTPAKEICGLLKSCKVCDEIKADSLGIDTRLELITLLRTLYAYKDICDA